VSESLYASEIGDRKPIWCGYCDRETRLVFTETEHGTKARRCQNCHPQGHMLPVTYKKCRSGCGQAVYVWDVRSECGKHQPVGIPMTPPEKEKAK
jgi:hypothetical protein